MNNYIIKNCPAIKEITTLLTSEPPQFQKEWRCCTTGSNLKKCKNITDCVLKRIVALCNAYDFSMGLSEEILDLLEIEEVDE